MSGGRANGLAPCVVAEHLKSGCFLASTVSRQGVAVQFALLHFTVAELFECSAEPLTLTQMLPAYRGLGQLFVDEVGHQVRETLC